MALPRALDEYRGLEHGAMTLNPRVKISIWVTLALPLALTLALTLTLPGSYAISVSTDGSTHRAAHATWDEGPR